MRLLALFLIPALLSGQVDIFARGKRVVDEALAALGGDAFLNMKDRTETGRAYSFYREKLSGLTVARIYTRYLTAPATPNPKELYVRERQTFGKKEDSSILFNEQGGWEIAWRGARPLTEELLTRHHFSVLTNIFYILKYRLREPGIILQSKGSDVWLNQPVEIVDITDAENRTVTVYFHKSTKLPLRQFAVRRDDKTRERFDEVTLYSKYRDIGGGVEWPYTVERERNDEKIFQLYADSATANTELTDNLFTLPANLKILPKPK
ncbi:MAG: hypothetical protein NTY38_18225 [Acidobacteria bacterium]|nr:hypothetical protein [Acidobacteriota bacterium]